MMRSKGELVLGKIKSEPLNKAPNTIRSKSKLVLGRFKRDPLPITNEAPSAIQSKSELAVGRFNSEPLSNAPSATTSNLKSELVMGRFKSEPLPITNDSPSAIRSITSKSKPSKYKPGLPGCSRLAGAPAASNLSFSRKKVGSNLPHLKSSHAVATIDNGFKSRTSSGSAFYTKVITRQVFQAAEQAAKRANSGPTLKPPQKAPQMLLPPSPNSSDSAVCKIIASLLGLLILGWHVCIYVNLWCLIQRG